jgi:hypothetical protein
MIDIAGRVAYISEEIAPGMRELDHASEMLQSGEYISDEITIGIRVLSNLKVRGDFGARMKTAIKSTSAEPHALINTTLIGSMVSVACERNG